MIYSKNECSLKFLQWILRAQIHLPCSLFYLTINHTQRRTHAHTHTQRCCLCIQNFCRCEADYFFSGNSAFLPVCSAVVLLAMQLSEAIHHHATPLRHAFQQLLLPRRPHCGLLLCSFYQGVKQSPFWQDSGVSHYCPPTKSFTVVSWHTLM